MTGPSRRGSGEFPKPMMDEVHAHVKEMLEVGAICGSVLSCKLNARTKRDSYLLPWIQEAIRCLAGAGYFSCLDLKTGFWQIAMDQALKQYTAFTMGNLGFFECEHMLFWLCKCPDNIPKIDAELSGQTEHDLLPNLLG